LATRASAPIIARVDSGADISLISTECLEAIPEESRPPIKRGLRMNLFQLTNGFKIEGFVQLPIFLEADDGDWLVMEGEFYVVPGMTSQVLLGEDLQVNYELGPPKIRNFSIVGRGAAASFVRAKSHRRNRTKRQRKRVNADHPAARAAGDAVIQPHACRRLAVHADFTESQSWFIEKTVLGQPDGSYLLTTPTLIDGQHTFVAISNPTDRPVTVHKGEMLGRMQR
ncbi:hypothetical protein DAEQUDRAFT_653794, partial [Daedalea quercina L-15889]